jgi:hypothetical protein
MGDAAATPLLAAHEPKSQTPTAGHGVAPAVGSDPPRRRRLIPLTSSTDSEDTKQGA